MPFNIGLPPQLSNQGWRLKIRDKERLEPPHVSVIKRTQTWRWDLRARGFMDKEPDPDLVPEEILDIIKANLTALQQAWDVMYPENPISSEEIENER